MAMQSRAAVAEADIPSGPHLDCLQAAGGPKLRPTHHIFPVQFSVRSPRAVGELMHQRLEQPKHFWRIIAVRSLLMRFKWPESQLGCRSMVSSGSVSLQLTTTRSETATSTTTVLPVTLPLTVTVATTTLLLLEQRT
jgi:hypothetical protein